MPGPLTEKTKVAPRGRPAKLNPLLPVLSDGILALIHPINFDQSIGNRRSCAVAFFNSTFPVTGAVWAKAAILPTRNKTAAKKNVKYFLLNIIILQDCLK